MGEGGVGKRGKGRLEVLTAHALVTLPLLGPWRQNAPSLFRIHKARIWAHPKVVTAGRQASADAVLPVDKLADNTAGRARAVGGEGEGAGSTGEWVSIRRRDEY